MTFAQSNTEIEMNLTDREKSTLVLDPRTVWNKQVFDDTTMSNDCKDELKIFYRDHHVQTKSYHRCKNNNDDDEPSPDRTETDESDHFEQKSDSSTRFPFNRIVPDDSPVNNEHVSEAKKECMMLALQIRIMKELFRIGLNTNPNGNNHIVKIV